MTFADDHMRLLRRIDATTRELAKAARIVPEELVTDALLRLQGEIAARDATIADQAREIGRRQGGASERAALEERISALEKSVEDWKREAEAGLATIAELQRKAEADHKAKLQAEAGLRETGEAYQRLQAKLEAETRRSVEYGQQLNAAEKKLAAAAKPVVRSDPHELSDAKAEVERLTTALHAERRERTRLEMVVQDLRAVAAKVADGRTVRTVNPPPRRNGRVASPVESEGAEVLAKVSPKAIAGRVL